MGPRSGQVAAPVAHLVADLAIVGGGLHGGLLAWTLLGRHPAARIVLVERGDRLGGDHTWCAFDTDLPAAARSTLAPLVAARWDGYEVRFPRLARAFDTPYLALTSARFDAALRERFAAAPNARLVLDAEVARVEAHRVRLADGRTLRSDLVVDARGPSPDAAAGGDGRAGFQKFVGLEVRLAAPAGLARPVVMDATVPQRDDFRFVYVLPFAPDRLLVEDTYFSDSPRLDVGAVEDRVRAYAAAAGWEIAAVLRRESGVLPMPWTGGPRPEPAARPLVLGYRGGWYHPGTGYSLPWAVRVAHAVAAAWPAPPTRALAPLARRLAAQASFARALNFGLFRAVRPADRWRILERFHRLPADTIARFYPLQSTPADRARMLAVNVPEIGALTGRLRELLPTART